ncbi:hypothetical protein DSM107003_38710 [Trichormus variabilis SAG 1403-4b]|uniref:Uncharacterized protein n=2 Tax=Anabaena variabilis TaxID=264691 RepID=A0A433UKG4_ANAVA|nr:hypothetical protein DSM107003_38710 [Trichormus variabilis SAG 1403-4b]
MSFILAIIATIFVRYGTPLERYSYGLNYFKDYQRPQFGLSASHAISFIFVVIAFILLSLGLRLQTFPAREIKWPNIKTIIFTLAGLVGLLLVPSVLSLVSLFCLFLAIISWTGIPTIGIGIVLIFMASRSFSSVKGKCVLIYLVVIAHILIPWIYPELLADKYKLGFDSGFAEAVETNIDISSIHNWMAEQNCLKIETYKGDEGYNNLPNFIRSINPSSVRFTSSCGNDKVAHLILDYPSTWIDPFGLAIVYPPISSEQLIREGYEGSPINDDCSCYIHSPSK